MLRLFLALGIAVAAHGQGSGVCTGSLLSCYPVSPAGQPSTNPNPAMEPGGKVWQSRRVVPNCELALDQLCVGSMGQQAASEVRLVGFARFLRATGPADKSFVVRWKCPPGGGQVHVIVRRETGAAAEYRTSCAKEKQEFGVNEISRIWDVSAREDKPPVLVTIEQFAAFVPPDSCRERFLLATVSIGTGWGLYGSFKDDVWLTALTNKATLSVSIDDAGLASPVKKSRVDHNLHKAYSPNSPHCLRLNGEEGLELVF